MLEALSSLFTLRFTSTPTLHPLPPSITRTFINHPSTPHNQLELLVSNPLSPPLSSTTSTTTVPPILFIHGGFGSASVWLPFLTHLSSTTSAQCFAISTRNHGSSHPIPYLRMVWATSLHALSTDVAAAIAHITTTTGRAPVLVAHSSGGGLAQYLLASGMNEQKVPGLVLLDAVPYFGNLGVYRNWAVHDPWFLLRTLVHGYHPISPLSSVGLVRGAFFGDGNGTGEGKRKGRTDVIGDKEVKEFIRWMPSYESLIWPMQMAGSFWAWISGRPRWLDVKDVLRGVDVGGKERGDRICVMSGDRDVLMDVNMCRDAAEGYEVGIREVRGTEKIEGGFKREETEEKIVEKGTGVRIVVVKGAGHHSQNDLQWKVAAEELRNFVEQL